MGQAARSRSAAGSAMSCGSRSSARRVLQTNEPRTVAGADAQFEMAGMSTPREPERVLDDAHQLPSSGRGSSISIDDFSA